MAPLRSPSVDHDQPDATQTITPPETASSQTSQTEELEELEMLERDLAAVEEAMSGLDRIDVDALGGHAAAAQVASIIDDGRFAVADGSDASVVGAVPGSGSQLVGDRLVDEQVDALSDAPAIPGPGEPASAEVREPFPGGAER